MLLLSTRDGILSEAITEELASLKGMGNPFLIGVDSGSAIPRPMLLKPLNGNILSVNEDSLCS